jgi:hypothetical protein
MVQTMRGTHVISVPLDCKRAWSWCNFTWLAVTLLGVTSA